MTSPLQNIEWEACLLEPVRDPALEAFARRRTGLPHPSVRYFARAPWVVRTMVHWLPEYGLLMELDLHTADLIALVVSQENSCRFCYAATRAFLRIQGMSEERIQRLEEQLARVEVEPRLAAIVRFSRRLAHCNPPVGEAELQALRQSGLSDAVIREIAFTVAAAVLLNRLSTIAAIPPQELEQTPDMLYVRWLRPVLARWLESHRKAGKGGAKVATAGPFGQVVQAFDGSPIAPVLSQTLADMLAATALTERCRMLLFAVIARGLDSEGAEREARTALVANGFSEDRVAHVLSHLDAPELDPAERELVPFARETIRYEPAQLQRKSRLLSARLSAEQLTDAIGVVSLANAICRLHMAMAAAQG